MCDEPNIFICLEAAKEDVERGSGWGPLYELPCGGLVVCPLRDVQLAYKRFACHEFDADAEFPLERLAICCTRVKVDKLSCPAVKRLLKAFGVADDIVRYKRPVLAHDAGFNGGAVYLCLSSGTAVYDGDDKLVITRKEIDGARRTKPLDMVEIFKGFEREACYKCENGENVHGGIIAFFKRLFGRRAK